MRKSMVIRIVQVLIVLAMLWMIFALKVSWSRTDYYAMLAKEKNELLLKEQVKAEKLRSKLDSCNQILTSLRNK
ncbi:hypothetical protein WSM22_31350 [Cytophagales bacterium WSM2-2]|nr:hypothetical protein WSM22_31350 [Cytophagales bacterium WSM2-2]